MPVQSQKSAAVLALAMLVAVGLLSVVGGQEPSDPPAKKSPKAAAKSPAKSPSAKPTPAKSSRPAAAMPAFTPEREAAAMKFVREHHAEVADLLDNLRKSRPEQYRRAARELFRASERVSQWKGRDAARYELELKAWKVNSRIQLLLARSAMSADVDMESELKSLIAERIDTRLAIRRHDREQLAKRLADADADIARLSADRDANIDRQLSQMRQNIKSNRQRIKSSATKNAKKSTTEKQP